MAPASRGNRVVPGAPVVFRHTPLRSDPPRLIHAMQGRIERPSSTRSASIDTGECVGDRKAVQAVRWSQGHAGPADPRSPEAIGLLVSHSCLCEYVSDDCTCQIESCSGRMCRVSELADGVKSAWLVGLRLAVRSLRLDRRLVGR